MNFDKIALLIFGVVLGVAAIGQLGQLQTWVWKAQAKVIYESRTSAWGSPRFFPEKSKEKFKTKKIRSTFFFFIHKRARGQSHV